jgi:hypothetical protein
MAKPCECGEWLLWPLTENNIPTPVLRDQPNPDGRVAVRRVGNQLRCRIITDARPVAEGEVLYMSHFAECRFADRYRKKDKPTEPKRPRGAPIVSTEQGTLI